MIAGKLVHLIEKHSDELARGLMERLMSCERVADLRKVPREELQQRAYEVYRHLSDYVMTTTESEIEQSYTAIGARRAAQGVAVSSLLYAIIAVKEHLWDFLRHESVWDQAHELFQERELLQVVDRYFDRALYFAARGYEQATKGHAN
jgi:hypothetical protein